MSKYMVLGAALMIVAATVLPLPAMGDALVEWQVTFGPNEETSADWSADGENIIYDYRVIPGDEYDVWTSPASGGPRQPLITGPGNQILAEWSIDNEIAFASNHEGGAYDIYVAPATGGIWQPITSHPATDSYPAWSPDGQWIAFQSSRSGNDDIWIVPADLSEAPRQITFDPADDKWPSWSPDGTEIAFASARSSPYGHIWIKPVAEGSAARQLTDTPGGWDWNPDWQPFGSLITFWNADSGDVFVVPADGSATPEPMTFYHGQDGQPTWSPTGDYIAYDTTRSGGFFDIWACLFDPPVAVPDTPTLPPVARLGQNEPNPFNPTTSIRIRWDQGATDARLEIFDTGGHRVRSIPLAAAGPSELEVTWDGLNDGGIKLPSGTYLYRIAYDGGATSARKAVLLK